MKLLLKRKYFLNDTTIGELSIDGEFFSYILEDKDRGLCQNMGLDLIKQLKVHSQTAIPTGIYKVDITYSQRYKKQMPLVCDVIGYEGIRIHPGNTHHDTAGCLLPGLSLDLKFRTVTQSTLAFNKLFDLFKAAQAKNEPISIEIVR